MEGLVLGAGIIGVLTGIVQKIVFALIVWIVGKMIVNKILGLIGKTKGAVNMDPTVRTFMESFFKIGLYAILLITIIGILGVPMASVVAVLASAGVTVGLALQGALSNLAGGIMLLVFKPFKVGDYVDAAGASGTVREVTLFYTVIITVDNRRITVPNGSLMNANVVNYSSEEKRRVDLSFSCAKSEDPARIQEIIQGVMAQDSRILSDPDAPFARLCGGTAQSMDFSVRAWCSGADYWGVYFDLTQKITEAFAANNVAAPASVMITKTE